MPRSSSLLLATAASAETTAGGYQVLPSFASTRGGTQLVFRWGAELPIAREEDYRSVIVLPDVPVDDRYRVTLRIYNVHGRTMQAKVDIETADGRSIEHLVTLQGPCGQFVTQCNSAQPGRPGPADLWAFVSVTNKNTQHVTTIRPQ